MTSEFQPPRFVSSTILLGSFSILNILFGFGGIVILTRHLETEVFGFYTLIMVVVAFLVQTSNFGMDLSVSKFIAGATDESSREHYLISAVIIRFVSVLLTGLFCWLGENFLILLFGKSLVPNFLVYVFLLFVWESFRALLKSALQGCLLFAKIGFTDLIGNFFNFILLLVVVYGLNADVIWLVLAKVFSSFTACLFAYLSIPLKKRFSLRAIYFKDLIRFGFPLQINDILGFINSRVDTLVVAALLGSAGIAFYEVARKIPDNLRLLYEPFRQVYYPFLAKWYILDDKRQADSLVNDSLRFVAFFALFGVAITVLFSRDIIRLFFSEKYLPSSPAFIVLMINLSIALVSNVMGTALVAVGDTRKPMIINFFNAIFSWLGSIILIPLFAFLGAAFGNILGTVIAFPLNAFFLHKKIALKGVSYLKPLLLFGAWGLLVFFLQPESVLVKSFLLVAFLACNFFLSVITRKDIILVMEGSRLNLFSLFKRVRFWQAKP